MARGVNRAVLGLLWLISATACSNVLDAQAYATFIVSNELTHKEEKLNEGLNVSFTYLTAEYMALLDNRSSLAANTTEGVAQSITRFSEAIYFLVQINNMVEGDGKELTTDQISYFVNRSAQRDIYLQSTEGHPVYPILVDYQNSYGVSPAVTVLVAFPKTEALEKKTLSIIYSDRLFGTGNTATASYNIKKLQRQLPALKL